MVILERPKIAPQLEQIRGGLAAALGVQPERVSVKGKTNEGVDALGRGEAIAAHAVALLAVALLTDGGSRPWAMGHGDRKRAGAGPRRML